MRRTLVLSVVIGSLWLLLAGGGILAALTRDARYDLCPVGGGTVAANFPLERAREFWDAVPRAGKAPELDNDKPAYVVIFTGPVNVPVFGAPPRDEQGNRVEAGSNVGTYTGVVCVVIDDSPIVYTDIDLTGARQ